MAKLNWSKRCKVKGKKNSCLFGDELLMDPSIPAVIRSIFNYRSLLRHATMTLRHFCVYKKAMLSFSLEGPQTLSIRDQFKVIYIATEAFAFAQCKWTFIVTYFSSWTWWSQSSFILRDASLISCIFLSCSRCKSDRSLITCNNHDRTSLIIISRTGLAYLHSQIRNLILNLFL